MLTTSQQGVFRPIVSAAWKMECARTGKSPNDRRARENWYRRHLMDTVGIYTTKQATRRDYIALCRHFSELAPEEVPISLEGVTEKQQAAYDRLVLEAWEATIGRDEAHEDFHAWQETHLRECGVVPPLYMTDRVDGFDAVAAHFAIIAGNEFWIRRTAEAAEIRMRFLIRERIAWIGELTGRPLDWAYAAATYAMMDLVPEMDEAPWEMLWKVFQALDTHFRRLEETAPADPIPF